MSDRFVVASVREFEYDEIKNDKQKCLDKVKEIVTEQVKSSRCYVMPTQKDWNDLSGFMDDYIEDYEAGEE